MMGLNLADFGGLRDVEFRKFFIESNYNTEWVLSRLEKEEISDQDLIQFYFAYSNLCDKYPRMVTDLTRTLFSYKLGKISQERLIHFEKIIKEKTGLRFPILTKPLNYMYYSLSTVVDNDEVFQELVDIFLDEV